MNIPVFVLKYWSFYRNSTDVCST